MKFIDKLYQKSRIWFAIVWIIVYVDGASITDEVSRVIGIERIISVAFLLLLCAVAFIWIKKNKLFIDYGLCKTDIKAEKFLYYL